MSENKGRRQQAIVGPTIQASLYRIQNGRRTAWRNPFTKHPGVVKTKWNGGEGNRSERSLYVAGKDATL